MSEPEKRSAAEKAVAHVFQTIREDPEKFWLLGRGTQSWELLSEVYAELIGEDPEAVKRWGPDEERVKRFREEKDRKAKILEAAEDEDEDEDDDFDSCAPDIIEISVYDDCYCAADADDPGGYLRYISGLPAEEVGA